MKIALVCPYDFAHPGGVANHITALDNYFTKLGHQVRVIAPASSEVSNFGDRFIRIGTPYPFPSSGSIIRIAVSINLGSTIKEVLSREKFDIVHLHEPFMPMLCSAILRFSNATNIGTFHAYQGRPGYNFGRPITSWMIGRRARKLHGRIAVSEPAKSFANGHVRGDYRIIPNGIDNKHFSPDVTPIEEFCDGKQNILFVGRLEIRKGLNYLLKAYLQVKREISNSRLIIVGPGTRLRKRYGNWVKHNALKDVVFVGYSSFADLPRYYQTADIFCAPATSRESFGIVLLEAMAVGKPIVASNIDGYASVLTNGEEGILVPPKNSHELACALISLLNNQALRQQMGTKGRITSAKYSWELIARKVLDYYTEVLNAPSVKNP